MKNAILLTALLAMGATHAAPTQQIPGPIVERIAVASLPPGAKPDQVSRRAAEFKDWVSTNGGGGWYEKYRAQYGAPVAAQSYVAETAGLGDEKLGLYYIHQPATSGQSLTAYACTQGDNTTPTIRGLCALARWNAFTMTKDAAYRDAFLRDAEWFNANAVDGKWLWKWDVPARGMKAPWISGIPQSLGVSVLLRAYQATSDEKYLKTAKQAYGWLAKPVASGGLSVTNEFGTWIEEYPQAGHPDSVLNGHLWALFGVWDYYRVTKDRAAQGLFLSGAAAVKNALPWFDTGVWAVYDKRDRKSVLDGKYMQFVTQQMRAMYGITGEDVFLKTAQQWETYQSTDALFVEQMARDFSKKGLSGISGGTIHG